MNRYVFVKHVEQSFEGIHALIRKHKPGRGVRAQVPLFDHEVTHVYALEGETTEELDALTTEAVGDDQVLLSADVCASPPCELLGSLFRTTPMWMPPFEIYIYLHIELEDAVELEVDGDFVLPDIGSDTAGAPLNGGKELLVQLGGDDLDLLLHDVGVWLLHPRVGRVRAYRGSGTDMVRNPDR